MKDLHGSRSCSRVLLLASLLGPLACGNPEDLDDLDSIDQPIIKGTATFARPEVGTFSAGDSSCSATLISKRHVLTAAHCIDYEARRTGGTFTVERASDGSPTTFEVAATYAFNGNPNRPKGKTGDATYDEWARNGVGKYDFAIGFLQKDVPESLALPAVIADRLPEDGETVTSIGYGCNAKKTKPPFGTGGGTKRFREYTWPPVGISCPGDSGGPAFIGKLNDRGEVVAIHSGSDRTRTDRQDAIPAAAPLKNRIQALIRSIGDAPELEVGFNRPGMDLKTVLNVSTDPHECRVKCQLNPECKAFSLLISFHSCTLKSGVPAPVSASSDYVSGVVDGGFEVGIDRVGFDIPGSNPLTADSAVECRDLCTQSALCQTFSFVPSARQCWLKHKAPGATPNENVVSGTPARRGNFDRPGYDLPGMPLTNHTVESCDQACALRSDCLAYTFVGATSACWLKWTAPAPSFACSTCVSGVRKAHETGVDRPGSDIGSSVTRASAFDCASTCAKDARCRSWSWVKSTRKCFKKSGTPAPVQDLGVISGIRAGHEINVDRPGGDIGGPTILADPDPDECQRLCNAKASCKAWTLVTKPANVDGGKQNKCYLKRSIPAGVSRNGMISGLKGAETFVLF